TPFAKTCKHATKQALCLLGNRSFGYASPQRYALALLTNMLGGPCQNSLLNIALREAHGLAYNVEVAATLYSECGATTIYFGTEKSSVDKCLHLVNIELDKLRNHPLRATQLSRTKRQLLGQLAIASDSNEQAMLGFGKSMLNYGRVDSRKEVRERILAISAEQLRTLACEVFDPNAMSSLMYV
ncbi:MAG: insulinase family protein, partial [Prevotellaceae bacterium]|nr:insulinase family protein [Prevotellaceae bacterium]